MLVKKLAVLATILFAAGCHCGSTYSDASYGSAYRDADYGLPPDAQIASGPAPQEKAFVDRHPLFSAPRNYYRDSGDNIVVKVLAGTLVGVPVGIAQEAWQIGYGQ
jgi:hypothetical protein